MIKAISLVATIFQDLNFAIYLWDTISLTEIFKLQKKSLKSKIVNNKMRQIWANAIIGELELLSTKNLV